MPTRTKPRSTSHCAASPVEANELGVELVVVPKAAVRGLEQKRAWRRRERRRLLEVGGGDVALLE